MLCHSKVANITENPASTPLHPTTSVSSSLFLSASSRTQNLQSSFEILNKVGTISLSIFSDCVLHVKLFTITFSNYYLWLRVFQNMKTVIIILAIFIHYKIQLQMSFKMTNYT